MRVAAACKDVAERSMRTKYSNDKSTLGKIFLLFGLLAALSVRAQAVEATLVADAHVNSARPTVNSGAISNINVGAGYTGLLQFDLGNLPSGTTSTQIAHATLRLYTNRADTAGLVSLQPLNGAWSEYGVNYQTLPATGSASQVFPVSQAGQYVAVDVTALVQGWISAPTTNFGLSLTAGTASVQFDSKENDLTGHQPTLDIQIVSQGPAGPQGIAGPAGAAGPAGTGAAGPQGPVGAAGPAGATGPAGPIGLPGPQGIRGLPGLGFEGTYSSTTNYGLNDVVAFAGSSYVSTLSSNHGNTPGFATDAWILLAAMGSSGAAGPAGIQGTAGAAGIQGPAGIAGDAGAAGKDGAPGLPGLVYQGAYQSVHNYVLGDVVLWQGSSWSSLVGGNHGNTPDQSPASWGILTQQGPQGIPGAIGAAGPQGIAGALGPVGPPGERGNQGLQGIPGQAGAQGIPGTTGTTGLSGPMGPQGPAGPIGLSFQGAYQSGANYALADGVQYNGTGYVSLIAGNHGNTPDQSPAAWALFAAAGAPGTAGATGSPGSIGPVGPQGAQGLPGPTGSTGQQGPQGPAVVNYKGNYSSASNYAVADAVSYGGSTYVSLVAGNHGSTPDQNPANWAVLVAQGQTGAAGVAGPQGPPGTPGISGGTGPAGPQGPPVTFRGGWLTSSAYALGDTVGYGGGSYIALVANSGREPDVSPVYWAVLAQAGSAGSAGPQGATGLQGPTGYPGAQGPAGSAGVAGPAGPTGATGSVGPLGPAGASGPAGPQGTAGMAGATGGVGPAGPQGPPISFRGGWSAATSYAIGDTVSYSGSGYIAVAVNSGREPDVSPVYWGVLAQSGATGPAGPQGATGFQGPTGYPGPAGATGPAGPAGVAGPAGPTGPSGPNGPAGPAGVAGPTGSAGLIYQGMYSSSSNYGLNAAVTFQGSSYISIQANNAGNAPGSSPSFWSTLATAGAAGTAGVTGATGAAGVAGPTGPAGASASVQVGSVTTGAAGSNASVVNVGSASAAILNFTIPQGANGAAGTGTGGGTSNSSGISGIPLASMYHSVSYAATYYSLNNTNQSASEVASVLTWVPTGCTATQLTVYSQQAATITVTMRVGTPGSMVNSALTCQVSQSQSCTATGSVTVSAGSFLDLSITQSNSNPSGVWSLVACN